MARRSYAGGGIFSIEEDEISHVDVMCYGKSTGSLAVIVHGGVPPYQFSIDGVNWQDEEYFDNLPVPANAVKSTDEYGGIWIGEYIIYCRDSNGKYANVKAIIQSPVKREWIENPNNTPNYDNGKIFFVPDAGKNYATPLPNMDYYGPAPSTTAGDTTQQHTVYSDHYNVGATTVRYTISSRGCRENDVYEPLVLVAPRRLPNAIQDYDGNWYDAVIIGNQVWLGSNLRTTHYADGTEITDGNQDPNDQYERFYVVNGQYYYNRPCVINGWNEGDDPYVIQGVSPQGWHIPTYEEYQYLQQIARNYYDFATLGEQKPYTSTTGWQSSTNDASPGKNPELNNGALLDIYPYGSLGGNTHQLSGVGQQSYIPMIYNNDGNNYMPASNPRKNWCINFSYYSNLIGSAYEEDGSGNTYETGMSVRCVCDMNALDFIKWYWNTYGSFDHQLS